MPILDSQVHAYERNHSRRPWIGTLYGPPEVTGDQMVTAMDAVGVDGAILVSPFSMYRYDASYALDVFAAHRSRFRLVKPVDPTDPAVVDTIADWASTYGTVGIRIFLRDNVSSEPADPTINRVLATAAQHSLPVNVACTGRLDQARHLAARNPNTRLVIDHLGLPQTARAAAARGAVRRSAEAARPGLSRQCGGENQRGVHTGKRSRGPTRARPPHPRESDVLGLGASLPTCRPAPTPAEKPGRCRRVSAGEIERNLRQI